VFSLRTLSSPERGGMVCFLKEVSECECCLELRSGMGNGGQMKKKTWKFSRATLRFCQAEQVEGSDG
jgi:hypothetical protein